MHEKTVFGVVTLAQENRFQLVDDAGVAHLFFVAHDVAVDGTLLEQLADSRVRVRVTYRKAPQLIAHLAIAIETHDHTEMDHT